MEHKAGHAPIKNEADNGLKNQRGTLAMARTNDLHSATSQFFINLVDNDFLNHRTGNFGYAVFGRVTQGIDVIDKIAKVKTGRRHGHDDVPAEAVVIKSARRAAPPDAQPPMKRRSLPARIARCGGPRSSCAAVGEHPRRRGLSLAAGADDGLHGRGAPRDARRGDRSTSGMTGCRGSASRRMPRSQ